MTPRVTLIMLLLAYAIFTVAAAAILIALQRWQRRIWQRERGEQERGFPVIPSPGQEERERHA